MSLRKSFLGCLLVATALIMLHHVHADSDMPSSLKPCERYGGVCMHYCEKKIQRPSSDCKNEKLCCVVM